MQLKIQNLRFEERDDRARVSADITWEENLREKMNIYFETDREFASALSLSFHPFLVGSILVAMHHREKRVSVEGEVCPELCQNLITAMNWIRHWYYDAALPLVKIEPGKVMTSAAQADRPRSASFMSGGVDSLATLKNNLNNFPRCHPAAITENLMIFGQNLESDTRPATFQKARGDLSELVGRNDIQLIPVYTNIRQLDDSSFIFGTNHGAILGAVAHAFANRFTDVYLPASDSIPTLKFVRRRVFLPYGSHPLLDPQYSSHGLRIKHDGIVYSRLDKVKMISEWDEALNQIRVCGPNWPGKNCGQCEKCIRTMLDLLAAGVLHKSSAFEADDVTAEMIDKIRIKKPDNDSTVDDEYLELIEPLERLGRKDLAQAIVKMIDRSFYPRKNMRQKLRRIDKVYFEGVFSLMKKKMFPNVRKAI